MLRIRLRNFIDRLERRKIVDKRDELDFIGKNAGQYLEVVGKDLESRIEKINLSSTERKEILKG